MSTGLCECGCGERTRVATKTDRSVGQVRGRPLRFVNGHNRRRSAESYTVEDRGFETPCYVWQRWIRSNGYGQDWDAERKRSDSAHVLAWERVHGSVPPGLELDHRCRVRACVRVGHLALVTRVENVRRGLRTKLAREQVVEIRRLAAAGQRQRELAAAFGVARPTISSIVCRRSWRDV